MKMDRSEFDKLVKEADAWQRTYYELVMALSGDRRALAMNSKKVAIMRQREQRGEDPNRGE